MVRSRPDLDGLRLHVSGGPDVWLMFGGQRHWIASSAVYDALWSEVDGLVSAFDVALIEEGHELGEGTCLVRPDGSLAIHLLTSPQPGEVVRCFVPTYESLLDFGFDEAKVRDVPPLLLDSIPAGPELTSAADRLR